MDVFLVLLFLFTTTTTTAAAANTNTNTTKNSGVNAFFILVFFRNHNFISFIIHMHLGRERGKEGTDSLTISRNTNYRIV